MSIIPRSPSLAGVYLDGSVGTSRVGAILSVFGLWFDAVFVGVLELTMRWKLNVLYPLYI